MKNNYETSKGRAGIGRVTPRKPRPAPPNDASETAFALPDAVNIPVGELAGELEEGLLALAVPPYGHFLQNGLSISLQ